VSRTQSLSDTTPTHELTIHPSAKRSLSSVPPAARDRLTEVLGDVAARREPSGHRKVKHLSGNNSGLLRLRVGDYRCVLEVVKPEVRVLRVRERSNAYDAGEDDELQRRRA